MNRGHLVPDSKKQAWQERHDRVMTAMTGGIPDRVPLLLQACDYYWMRMGIPTYAAMRDIRVTEPGVRTILNEVQPDLASGPMAYDIDILSALGAEYIKYAGPDFGLDLTAPFQFIDGSYMEDDEFDDFLTDPTHFIITKLMGRKNKNLKGLAKVNFQDVYEHLFNMNLSAFADEEVRKSCYALLRAGEYAAKYKERAAYVTNVFTDEGYPLKGGVMYAPFDIYANSIRGFLRGSLDCYEFPDELKACVDRIADMVVDRQVAAAKAGGAVIMNFPLHGGMDQFMSPENYEKFYWPGLKREIDGLVREGIIPNLALEGRYATRLDLLCRELPKDKVVFSIEETDRKLAKATIGQMGCIVGNFPVTLLMYGSKQEVIDETKRMIEDMAPGGRFIMSTNMGLANCDRPENVVAWAETTREYGKY